MGTSFKWTLQNKNKDMQKFRETTLFDLMTNLTYGEKLITNYWMTEFQKENKELNWI